MKKIHKISVGVAVLGFFVVASAAFAQTSGVHGGSFGNGNNMPFNRSVAGVVLSVNGSSLIMSVQANSTAAITNYTVNTANAKTLKYGTSTSTSNIQVNDKIAVIGSVSGNTITAKLVIDGIVPHTTSPPTWKKGGRTGSNTGHSSASSTRPSFVKPAAFGSVSSITGPSFIIAERTKIGTTTLSIDTNPSTAFQEGTTTASFYDLAVGNLVAVTGTTVSTNEISASKVMIMTATRGSWSFARGNSLGKGVTDKGFGGHKNGWSNRSASSALQ